MRPRQVSDSNGSDQLPVRAVVLVHLGTPAAPTPVAVRQFLREFLSDRRVVELPRLLWWPILYGLILPFRPRQVARAYQWLWRQWGDSPLRIISERQQKALQRRYSNDPSLRIERAMTYGQPGLSEVLVQLQREQVQQILLLPLYPQYSATTSGAVADRLGRFVIQQRNVPGIGLVKDYHDHPLYIEALAQSVEAHWRQQGRGVRLLMSFHGIPQRNVDRGDPYFSQCQVTAERLAARLQLAPDEWAMSFQSRLGRAQWLQPYTSQVLNEWGQQSLASVDILCPAFSVDCLETLEEIEVENRQIFKSAGGGDYRYIACLNDGEAHIDLLQELIAQHLPTRETDMPGQAVLSPLQARDL